MRIMLAFAVAFVGTWLLGKIMIPWLRRMKAGQSIKEDGPTWHMAKQGIPTMGGLMFIAGIPAALLIAGWQDVAAGNRGALFVYLFALVFGCIGWIDDYMKVKHHHNTGLTAPQKFLLQLAAAVAFVALMRYEGYLSPNVYVPFWNGEIVLSWVVYMVFAAFVIVATVNAVNITDGVDGLASGVTLPVGAFYTCVAAYWGYTELGILAAALCGGLCAFLVYNHHPAKVFMGDTGSLFLGGMVCGMAFALDIPLIVVLVGIIYVAETLSDIIQIVYFKATHGKRIFRMAPLHHHFELGGWSEKKVVGVFSGITLAACVIALFGVVNRYPMG